MKRIRFFTVMLIVGFSVSCSEKHLNLYNGDSYLQFGPEENYIYASSSTLKDTLKEYSFFYDPVDANTLDIYFDIYALGGSKDFDREFILEQEIVEGANNAVEGVNYIGFGSDEMKSALVLKAGVAHMKVPVRVIQPAVTDSKMYTLKFRIVENDNFKLGEQKLLWRKLKFTHEQQKPTFWDSYVEDYFFGKYSRVKHSFMIGFSKLKWDDACYEIINSDEGLPTYWTMMFKKELIKVNKQLVDDGKDELMDEDGDLVEFP